jgi:hypothetical protein
MSVQKKCAWCGKDLPELKDQDAVGISHGMCVPCAKSFFNYQARSPINEKMRFLVVPDPKQA